MPSIPLSAEKQAQAKELAIAIRQATDADIEELARTLVDTDDGHPFSATEFKLRDIALKIAAKAIEQQLAQKKTATKAPV
jgi:parvulin-like peptidyl-prolyl isomerase